MSIKVTSAVNGIQIHMQKPDLPIAHRFDIAENRPFLKVTGELDNPEDPTEPVVFNDTASKAKSKGKQKAEAKVDAETSTEAPSLPAAPSDAPTPL